MSDPKHPTNPEWLMSDPLIEPPPLGGETLLLLNPGGVLIQGPWSDGCLAWAKKPKVPDSVKARITAQRQARIEEEGGAQ